MNLSRVASLSTSLHELYISSAETIDNSKVWDTLSISNCRGLKAIHRKISSFRWSLGKKSENTSRLVSNNRQLFYSRPSLPLGQAPRHFRRRGRIWQTHRRTMLSRPLERINPWNLVAASYRWNCHKGKHIPSSIMVLGFPRHSLRDRIEMSNLSHPVSRNLKSSLPMLRPPRATRWAA
jgi:hypothetical protein